MVKYFRKTEKTNCFELAFFFSSAHDLCEVLLDNGVWYGMFGGEKEMNFLVEF